MKTITTEQKESLVNLIFEMLKDCEDIGLGDLPQCYDSSEYIVKEWLEANNILLED